jgi:TctA family transporter
VYREFHASPFESAPHRSLGSHAQGSHFLLFSLIFLFCLTGVYTVENNVQDVYIMILFGTLGYLMKKCDYEPESLIPAFVLGPMFENAFRQSLIISGRSLFIYLSRPVATIFLLISFALLLSPLGLKVPGKQRPGFGLKEDR